MRTVIKQEVEAERRKVKSFLNWLKNRKVWINPWISIHNFEDQNQGFGMIANRDLDPSTTLFSIPRPKPKIGSINKPWSIKNQTEEEGGQPKERLSDEDESYDYRNQVLLNINTSEFFKFLSVEEIRKLNKNWNLLLIVLMYESVRSSLIRSKATSDYISGIGYEKLDKTDTNADGDDQNNWGPYFDLMPEEFDTLMFWSEEELDELKGSTILDKIGRQEAESDYFGLIEPFIRSRPDLFPVPNLAESKNIIDQKCNSKNYRSSGWEDFYGLQVYHRMGSLVLSRSFNIKHLIKSKDFKVEKRDDDGYESDCGRGMDIDEDGFDGSNRDRFSEHEIEDSDDDSDEDDDEEKLEDISMFPLADILNTKIGNENARLFPEPRQLKMKTTRLIKKGEQIFNSYDNPPNSDLLRRYGYVEEGSSVGLLGNNDFNEFDLVEISVEICKSVAQNHLKLSSSELEFKTELALENGVEDTFCLLTETQRKKINEEGIDDGEYKEVLPRDLICLLMIYLTPSNDLLIKNGKKIERRKFKLPKPRLSSKVIKLSIEILNLRLSQYPTTVSTDESLLAKLREDFKESKLLIDACGQQDKSRMRRLKRLIDSVIVRLGEKRILLQSISILKNQRTSIEENENDDGDRLESSLSCNKKQKKSHLPP
ncbi:expressed protein [Phakopsora pachyrhizi]|uniref:Expressed protein n=1 Tax=Phakopsora pachyrhizi TaxID=170000 RepID=A0AAV0AVN6_PHAPC|nr:expressed protein [Phakopsora pachyrhizi]